MRFSLITFSLISIAFLISCNHADPELVNKMDQNVEEAQKTLTVKVDSITTVLNDMKSRLDAYAVKTNDPGVKYLGTVVGNKVEAIVKEYNSTCSKIEQLKADYEAGKVKKEEAEKGLQDLTIRLHNLEGSFGRVSAMASRNETELRQIYDDFFRKQSMIGENAPENQALDAQGNNGQISADAAQSASDGAQSGSDAANSRSDAGQPAGQSNSNLRQLPANNNPRRTEGNGGHTLGGGKNQ